MIIYNDKDINYITGDVFETIVKPNYITYEEPNGMNRYIPTSRTFSVVTNNPINEETIKLDETLMKRIAKYNKEKELQNIDKKIKEKQEKIKELDDILKDREKRVEKIKKYIANIYDIDILNDEDEDEEYYY